MKSERSAGLFARLSKANSSEVREFADDAINNLGVPGTHLSSPLPHALHVCVCVPDRQFAVVARSVEGEEEEEEEEVVMAIDTRDENEQGNRRPVMPTLRRRTGAATVRETEAEKAAREKLQRTYIKRRQIINEILQTEKVYVKNVGLTVTVLRSCWSSRVVGALDDVS